MESNTMAVGQAMAIVAQICADFRGTLKEHRTIQQALEVIEQALQQDGQPLVELQPPAPAPAAAVQK